MTSNFLTRLETNLSQKNWAGIEQCFLPSSIPNDLLSSITINQNGEGSFNDYHLNNQINNMNWPHKNFLESFKSILFVVKSEKERQPLTDILNLYVKLFFCLSRENVLGNLFFNIR